MKTISQTLINLMLETGLLAFIVPVGLIAAWKIHIKKKVGKPFWTGVLAYVIFCVIVKYAVDLLFAGDNVVGHLLSSHGAALAVYNALAGSLLTVFGVRFMYYRTMNSFQDRQYCISFAAGFAGTGVVCRMGIPLVFYNFAANLYNFEITKKGAGTAAQIKESIEKQNLSFIKDIKWSTVSTLSISSFIGFVIEASAAVLVFCAIRKKLVEQGHIIEKRSPEGSAYGKLKANVVFWYTAILIFAGFIPLYIVTGRDFTDLHVLVPAEVIEAILAGLIAFFAKMVYDSLGTASEEKKDLSKEKAGHIRKMAGMKLSRIETPQPAEAEENSSEDNDLKNSSASDETAEKKHESEETDTLEKS